MIPTLNVSGDGLRIRRTIRSAGGFWAHTAILRRRYDDRKCIRQQRLAFVGRNYSADKVITSDTVFTCTVY